MKSPAFRVFAASAIAATVAATATVAPAAAAPAATPVESAFLAPHYVELDVTGDRQVTTDDLAVATAHLGLTAQDEEWPTLGKLDLDEDGVITIVDIATLSQRMIYDDGEFELVEASVVDLQAAMNAGRTSSVELTQAYLDRIAAYDRVVRGAGQRPLNSIVTTSAVALEAAAAADALRAESGMTSMLLGVPIALKDNYNTADMVTTAGCGCWNGNQTDTDAHMVEGLRADGAVILAKASLDEFAYGFVSEFSSFQPAGASSFVASPYDTTQSAGGSSGGTGASIAANLAAIGFGTDTGGSIRVPSSYNQLVGVRPTVGLASRDGIVPLALSQDTGGPMARSVTDAAVALDAVVGIDANDAVTARQEGLVPESYSAYLDEGALNGTRIGYVPAMLGTNANALQLWESTKARLEAAGATLVEITPPEGWSAVLDESSGSTNEFAHDLDAYISSHLNENVAARSIDQILATGNYVMSRESTYRQRATVSPSTYEAWAGPAGSHTLQLAAGKRLVTSLMDQMQLDAIAYPSGTPYGTIGTNMRLSPNTGMPAVTVPMGQIAEWTAPGSSRAQPAGNVNLELLGRDFDEGPLLGIAYAFEQSTHARTAPVLYPALAD